MAGIPLQHNEHSYSHPWLVAARGAAIPGRASRRAGVMLGLGAGGNPSICTLYTILLMLVLMMDLPGMWRGCPRQLPHCCSTGEAVSGALLTKGL
jgi:hypothetical protein